MRIETTGTKANVYTPYNADFVTEIKRRTGGKWNAAERCWTVNEDQIETVRKIMVEVYGESDIKEIERVSVRLTFSKDVATHCGSVVLMGREIATAWGRDSGARAGEGVTFEIGKPHSGGSRANWHTIINEGSVVVLSDVPKSAIDIFTEELEDNGISAEVVTKKIDRDALVAERERLTARLAEINAILGE